MFFVKTPFMIMAFYFYCLHSIKEINLCIKKERRPQNTKVFKQPPL